MMMEKLWALVPGLDPDRSGVLARDGEAERDEIAALDGLVLDAENETTKPIPNTHGDVEYRVAYFQQMAPLVAPAELPGLVDDAIRLRFGSEPFDGKILSESDSGMDYGVKMRASGHDIVQGGFPPVNKGYRVDEIAEAVRSELSTLSDRVHRVRAIQTPESLTVYSDIGFEDRTQYPHVTDLSDNVVHATRFFDFAKTLSDVEIGKEGHVYLVPGTAVGTTNDDESVCDPVLQTIRRNTGNFGHRSVDFTSSLGDSTFIADFFASDGQPKQAQYNDGVALAHINRINLLNGQQAWLIHSTHKINAFQEYGTDNLKPPV